ncbi:MAG: mercury methylation ferredoxin HgcB [Lentisphaerota bacterium]
MKYLSQDISLKLDAAKCTGCGLCMTVCPHGVFSIKERKAHILDRDACIECGACARNCLAGAITVKSGVGCAEAMINSLFTGKEACCGEGSCCSQEKGSCS